MSRACATRFKDEELLELYLTLPGEQRRGRFADTAHAAEIAGLTQRTVQLWIQSGAIRTLRFIHHFSKNCIPVFRRMKAEG